jgi:hypothetical protein
VSPDNVRLGVSISAFVLIPFSCLSSFLSIFCNRCANAYQASHDDPSSDNSASGRDDQFVVSPRPRRETRKSTCRCEASSSQADKEVTRIGEGRVVAGARDARARDEIQTVEHPLKSGFGYTLRRVDHCHPRMPMNFTLGEN